MGWPLLTKSLPGMDFVKAGKVWLSWMLGSYRKRQDKGGAQEGMTDK